MTIPTYGCYVFGKRGRGHFPTCIMWVKQCHHPFGNGEQR